MFCMLYISIHLQMIHDFNDVPLLKKSKPLSANIYIYICFLSLPNYTVHLLSGKRGICTSFSKSCPPRAWLP